MTSTHLSSVSALLLLLGGVLLLFAPGTVVLAVGTEVPASALWLAQLIGAGWLALAALNWLSRSSVLGGIYGRPVVAANLALYFISALVLIDARHWFVALPFAILAVIYGWLLRRGPRVAA
jgi:hypothetical protein